MKHFVNACVSEPATSHERKQPPVLLPALGAVEEIRRLRRSLNTIPIGLGQLPQNLVYRHYARIVIANAVQFPRGTYQKVTGDQPGTCGLGHQQGRGVESLLSHNRCWVFAGSRLEGLGFVLVKRVPHFFGG